MFALVCWPLWGVLLGAHRVRLPARVVLERRSCPVAPRRSKTSRVFAQPAKFLTLETEAPRPEELCPSGRAPLHSNRGGSGQLINGSAALFLASGTHVDLWAGRGRSRRLVGILGQGRTSVRCPRLWEVLYWRHCTVSLRDGETPTGLFSSSEQARSPQRTPSTRVSNSHEPAQMRTKIRDAANVRIDKLTCVSNALQKLTSNASSAVTQWKRER